jgi:glycerol-3-phosphate dehydrogenase (NAD(P)+)
MLDGLGLSSLKGALMARAPREISRLVEALGGNSVSVYGLCHLGDYEATVFSRYSHNRRYGESLITGAEAVGLAEGYYTAKALVELSDRLGVELPISRAVYNVIYNGASAPLEMEKLFNRSIKNEF